MARRRLKNTVIVSPDTKQLLAAASKRVNPKRVNLPLEGARFDYQDDVDTLYISLSNNRNATHSETDEDDSVIYVYEGKKLVGIEILDISGQLKHANPT